MRQHFGIALLLAACSAPPPPESAAPAPEPPAGGALLTVEIEGLASGEGLVAFALYADAVSYAGDGEPLRRALLTPAQSAGGWTVADLPYGRYAAKAYHDENGNRRLDTGPFGAPTEPYGFSNGARGRFGPPPFEEAAFEVAEPEVAIRIRLR